MYILNISCPDTVGIVADVAGFLASRGLFITESAHFGDPQTDRFFMRTVFVPSDTASLEQIRAEFTPIAERFQMQWAIHDTERKSRLMLLVSRFDHCLNDLLYRYRIKALDVEIPLIVSNHTDLRPLAEWHGIPFHHLPVTPDNKLAQEQNILAAADEQGVDLFVLARYMQVLSPALCKAVSGRAINIHHSFLPSFKGAKPYHQAHARGVKLIGATAHYVTTDLDEGPIIEQEVERVDHSCSAEDLVAIGRDIENRVLARAVRFHVERRVLMNGAKTIVFR